jgi:DNA mismatch repair protein MutS2
MNLKELWIGDRIRLLKSGRIGTFEGMGDGGKIRIKINEKIILTKKSNIELLASDYDNLPEEIEFEEEEVYVNKTRTNAQNNSKVIDLHLEKLDPQFNIPPIRAFDFQIEECKKFLDQSIQNNYNQVVIIHGKGSGILKSAIRDLLKDYREVYFIFEINKGGATEVWLK